MKSDEEVVASGCFVLSTIIIIMMSSSPPAAVRYALFIIVFRKEPLSFVLPFDSIRNH